jgi:hypothetical protein
LRLKGIRGGHGREDLLDPFVELRCLGTDFIGVERIRIDEMHTVHEPPHAYANLHLKVYQ